MSTAPKVIQQHSLAWVPSTKPAFYLRRDGTGKTHHPANNICIADIEIIIADSSPFILVIDFNTAHAIIWSINQANLNS